MERQITLCNRAPVPVALYPLDANGAPVTNSTRVLLDDLAISGHDVADGHMVLLPKPAGEITTVIASATLHVATPQAGGHASWHASPAKAQLNVTWAESGGNEAGLWFSETK